MISSVEHECNDWILRIRVHLPSKGVDRLLALAPAGRGLLAVHKKPDIRQAATTGDSLGHALLHMIRIGKPSPAGLRSRN